MQGISMLNPQRWTTGTSSLATKAVPPDGYSSHLDIDNAMVFEIGSDDEDEKEEIQEKESLSSRRCMLLLSHFNEFLS